MNRLLAALDDAMDRMDDHLTYYYSVKRLSTLSVDELHMLHAREMWVSLHAPVGERRYQAAVHCSHIYEALSIAG